MSADPRALLATLVTHLNAIWIIIGFLLWGRWADGIKLEEKGRLINTGKKGCRSTLAYYSNFISFIA